VAIAWSVANEEIVEEPNPEPEAFLVFVTE
jgi:hypothetical protein